MCQVLQHRALGRIAERAVCGVQDVRLHYLTALAHAGHQIIHAPQVAFTHRWHEAL
jgi:hypothetical protein